MARPSPRNTFGKDILAGIVGRSPGTPREIPISDIEADPNQPRKDFDLEKLRTLGETVKRWGILQPIHVQKGESKPWRVLHGERRWRAAQIAGLATIRAFVEDQQEEGRLARQVIENQHRADLPNSAIGRVIQAMTEAGERNADIALVVNLPEHHLKHYRIIPEMPETLIPWIDRLDMRTVYELYMAWTRLDETGRGPLEVKLAALDRDSVLSLAEARRIIQAATAGDNPSGTNVPGYPPEREEIIAISRQGNVRAKPQRNSPRLEVAYLRKTIERLLSLLKRTAETLAEQEASHAEAERIRAEIRDIEEQVRAGAADRGHKRHAKFA